MKSVIKIPVYLLQSFSNLDKGYSAVGCERLVTFLHLRACLSFTRTQSEDEGEAIAIYHKYLSTTENLFYARTVRKKLGRDEWEGECE